jgi:hypothetical protein
VPISKSPINNYTVEIREGQASEVGVIFYPIIKGGNLEVDWVYPNMAIL